MSSIDTHAQPNASGHGDHGHGHGQYPFLAHHFESPAQQFDSGKLGMWIFLATEILFFGALFAMYAIMRAREPQVFSYASHYLDTIMGGVNTCVLILSSLTMAMAVHYAQRSKKGPLVFCLFLTFLGACGFLVIKYFEYTHKFHVNLKWGPSFYQPLADHDSGHEAAPQSAAPLAVATEAVTTAPPSTAGMPLFQVPQIDAPTIKAPPAGPAGVSAIGEGLITAREQRDEKLVAEEHDPHLLDPDLPVNTHRFFAIYYAMTGLHGIHVVVGMFVIGGLMWGAMRGKYNSDYFTPVDLGGLYWHIVDLIWIFLFPLFYLIH